VVNTSITTVTPLLTTIGAALSAIAETQINGEYGSFTIEGDPASPQVVTVTTVPGTPNLVKIAVAAGATPPVSSVNGRTGAVTIQSSTLTISEPSSTEVEIEVTFPVTSVNGATGAVAFNYVTSVNGLNGVISLESTDGTVTITEPGGGAINLSAGGSGSGEMIATTPIRGVLGTSASGSQNISLAIPNVGSSWYLIAEGLATCSQPLNAAAFGIIAGTFTGQTFNPVYETVGVSSDYLYNAAIEGFCAPNQTFTFEISATMGSGGGTIAASLKAWRIS
jgi:hypothetical protein